MAAHAASVRSEETTSAYLDNQVMIAAHRRSSLASIAHAHGLSLLNEPGPSGYVALELPAGVRADDVLTALRSDDRVRAVSRVGIIRGTIDTGDTADTGAPDDLVDLQWHLDEINLPTNTTDCSGITIAVLDTGVAYEDYSDAWGVYTRAPSLSSTTFVSPYDFINIDAHANDDHQHGTHITSTIASNGMVMGVAPYAAIMPVKVLDENNQGTEIALINGITHAVDNGANIINMSLSFSKGYAPSTALKEALHNAWEAGVIMIAAAGNDSGNFVTWPAASPGVIAVGASHLDSGVQNVGASYSNRASAIDVMAPGGNIEEDNNGDGYPDGILAETFRQGDPEDFGYWFYAGTSQATAIMSGATAHLLAAGGTPAAARRAPARSARSDFKASRRASYEHGYGGGSLDLNAALTLINSSEIVEEQQWGVALLPFLSDGLDGTVWPTARISVLDDDGTIPTSDIVVGGTIYNQDQDAESFSCTITPADSGICIISGSAVDALDASGEPAALTWSIEVNYIISDPDGDAEVSRADNMIIITDELEILVAALKDNSSTNGALLMFNWTDTADEELGDLKEAFTILNLGTGLASSPLGLVMTPQVLNGFSTTTSLSIDLDGTGLASSPLGFASLKLITLDGTGLASSPLGFTTLRLIAIDGTGLASSPLGFRAVHMLSLGTGLASSPLGLFNNQPIFLGNIGSFESTLANSSIGTHLEDGGWHYGDGVEGASLLLGSGVAAVYTDLSDLDLNATGLGNVELGTE